MSDIYAFVGGLPWIENLKGSLSLHFGCATQLSAAFATRMSLHSSVTLMSPPRRFKNQNMLCKVLYMTMYLIS